MENRFNQKNFTLELIQRPNSTQFLFYFPYTFAVFEVNSLHLNAFFAIANLQRTVYFWVTVSWNEWIGPTTHEDISRRRPLQTLKMVAIDRLVKISVLNLYIIFSEYSFDFREGKIYKIYGNWLENGII